MERLSIKDGFGVVCTNEECECTPMCHLIEKATKKLAEYENTNRTPEQIQILIDDFESLNRQQGEIIKEVHKLREESDFWKREAIKSKAQLGEIRILAEKQ